MTPSMPSATMISAASTSMSVKPRCRSAPRIRRSLVVFCVGRLCLRNQLPGLGAAAALDLQIIVGLCQHAPQGFGTVTLDAQFKRHDVAARENHDLRRPFLFR